jgi:hypothetical protein
MTIADFGYPVYALWFYHSKTPFMNSKILGDKKNW